MSEPPIHGHAGLPRLSPLIAMTPITYKVDPRFQMLRLVAKPVAKTKNQTQEKTNGHRA
jgi:hypothetical protein